MKVNEAGFWGNFWDTLSGQAADVGKRQYAGSGAEAQAKENFKAKLAQRAVSALLSGWKNNGIDLSQTGFTLPSKKDLGKLATDKQSPGAEIYKQARQKKSKTTQAGMPSFPGATIPTQNIKMTYQGQPVSTNIAPVSTKPAAKTTTSTATTTQQPLTFGREKYTKGPKGWVDSKGKIADTNTAQILDKASVQANTKPRMRLNPATNKWEQISEQELLNDSKYSQWNNMLLNILNEESTPGGQSPSEFMYPIIKQMLTGYNFEKRPEIVQMIKTALTRWEEAFKNQIQRAGGKFDGRFDKQTQQTFDQMIQLVADQAFASLGVKGPTKPQVQQKKTSDFDQTASND